MDGHLSYVDCRMFFALLLMPLFVSQWAVIEISGQSVKLFVTSISVPWKDNKMI